MQTVVATARRALLMKEVVDEAAFRSSVSDDVEEKRCEAKPALRTLDKPKPNPDPGLDPTRAPIRRYMVQYTGWT